MVFSARAVDGIVQREFLQRIFVFGGNLDADFFDGADFGVAAGLCDAHAGRRHFAGFDEIVVTDANHFALIQHADVILPSLSMFTVALVVLFLLAST